MWFEHWSCVESSTALWLSEVLLARAFELTEGWS